MTLRMDDMHQKENTIKLSLQSMDFRLSFLEEIGRQNLETLTQLKQCISQLDVRSRNISSSSTKSSRMHLDSEDSVSDQVDILHYEDKAASLSDSGTAGRRKQFAQGSDNEKLLTPESNATMRSMPSPILVHSQKGLKDDSLHQFTDYTKPVVKTGSSVSRRSLDRQGSVKQRRSLPKLIEQSPECQPKSPIFKESSTSPPQARNADSLLGRRRGNLSKLRIDPLDDGAEPGTSQDTYETRLKDINTNLNNSSSVYSTAHIGSDTLVSTQNPADLEAIDITKNKDAIKYHDSSDSQNSGPPFLSISIPSPDHTGSFYASGAGAAGPESQPVYTIPFTPILTARSVEYTTITDEIDTTCMMNISPPRSPSTAIPQAENMWDEEKPEYKAVIKEKVTLKQAEETEHRKMEKVIRNRLRQISMDESDSISDIARLVIGEMEVEDTHSDHEEEDDMQGSSESLAAQSLPGASLQLGSSSHDRSSEERDLRGSPIVFEAVEIRIRRASTLDEDGQQLPKHL